MCWKVWTVLVLNFAAGLPAGAGQARTPSSADLFDQAKAPRPARTGRRRSPGSATSCASIPMTRASEARFRIGFSLVKSEEYEEAISELESFEGRRAKDPWADDALLQLGYAYRGHDENDKALAVWKRLRQQYPDSVWRTESAFQIIDVLFQSGKDYSACLSYCEAAVHENGDSAVITEARYVGAYCLNAPASTTMPSAG